MSTLFRLSNLVVLPFWALMILLPRWRWTARIVRSPLVIAVPALFYAGLVLPRLAQIWPAISRPTLGGIAALLGSPQGATIAWVHFLAFDLFVGRWIYLDSQGRRSVLLISPVLFLTFMLGPLGFLAYLIVRAIAPSASAEEDALVSPAKRSSQGSFGKAKQVLRRARGASRWLLHCAFSTNRPLTILGGAMLITFLATLVGLAVDHRVITGAPAWLKPAKFAISIAVYSFTFVWLLGYVKNRPRVARWAANVTVVSFIVEMTVILTQAARGTTSHFNVTTPLNSFLWLAMGGFIVVVWMMNLLLALLLILQRMPDRAFAWSLRFGLLVSLVGMAAAFFMVRPTPVQMAAMHAGGGLHIIGAHSVGVADGSPGLPLLGWSTVGGDLRVPHFFGLHAMQILPFFGWLITRRRSGSTRMEERHRLALVWTVGSAYLGIVLILIWQALRGQPVIHPDAQTLTAFAILALVTGISTLIIALRAKRTNRRWVFRSPQDDYDVFASSTEVFSPAKESKQ
jgi:hypothetical protein